MFDEMQPVWRTMSSTKGDGFFVWEVVQVVGENYPNRPYYTACSDGTDVMVQCCHFFSEKEALTFLNNGGWEDQSVTVI